MEDVIPQLLENIKKEFKDFKVVDEDENFMYMRKGEIGKGQVIEARILRGSLGAYDLRFNVEKTGCRSRLIGGNDSIKKVKKYLSDNKC